MAVGAALEVENIRRAYGSVIAVDNVSFVVDRGEFVTLLGPSGSGKTTTLRLVGGFEKIQSGAIRINGERVMEYDKLENLEEGFIELQAHRQGYWAEYKHIRIRPQ